MSYRQGRKTKLSASPGEQRRALLLILFIVSVPLLGTVAVVMSTGDTDLSDLSPSREASSDGDLILGWPSLRRGGPHVMVTAGRGPAAFNGAAVRVLGYMSEADHPIAKGERVRDFVLLPDCGNLLHPAHRLGDQMIAVHFRNADAVMFSPKVLVWVSGTLQLVPGDPAGARPLYSLEEAWSQVADAADVHKYFGPDRP